MFRKKINFDLDEFRSRPLPSEQEIMSGWTGDLDKPAVSVICNTYNQEMYIEDAIRGFLIQETDFPFEVIINDDASTDRNPEIIKSYAEKYPSIIKPVFQEENQYSQGRKPSVISFPYTSGDYIALCEGDDFWISPTKLQAQRDAIKKEKVGLVFSSSILLHDNKVDGIQAEIAHEDMLVPLSAVASGGGSFCPTASIMIRSSRLSELFNTEWFQKAPVGDLYVQVFCAIDNGAYFMRDPTCVYRQFAKGSWSVKKYNVESEWAFLNKQVYAIEGVSKYFGGLKDLLEKRMKANAYYHSALRFLRMGEYGVFRQLIERADSSTRDKSLGNRVFYFIRKSKFLSLMAVSLPMFRA